MSGLTAFWLGGPLSPEGVLQWTAPQWQIVTVVAVALGIWLLAARGDRPMGARLGELGALAVALAGVVVALARPVWVEEFGRTEPGRVVVLVDGSRSMQVIEEGEARYAAVEGILDHVRRQGDRVDVFHYGDDLGIGAPVGYDLPGTDLEGALYAMGERVAGERLAGVVVVSDGLDRGLLRKRFLEDGVEADAVELPGPLTVFQVGALSDLRDLSVHSVESGGYAFIRNPFTIRAQIQGVGFAGKTVPVSLERNGAPITSQSVTLGEDGRAEVSFTVTPEQAGRFAYEVTVPVYEGDAVPANNTLPLVVGVVRDRIRVLQVAGAPSWDVKFLRRFLKGDPSVQLVSFFILRTQRDLMAGYGENELSLIQFPYKRLFDDDLGTFDVVVFQNFDYLPYFGGDSTLLLRNLAEYVENGGGFVMTGGDRSFGLGRYGSTPLGDALPVEIAADGNQPDIDPFQPKLTAAGGRHPITRLTADGAENAAWWERLRPLDGTNVVLGPQDGAAVLLEHPTRMGTDGKPMPVLAVQEVGAGRTMALTVDSSWRWSMSEAAEGRGNQAYLRFWKNTLRWLMRDPSVNRVTVETARENYAVDEEVRLIVRVRDPSFAPLPDARVVATVEVGGEVSTHEVTTGADGDIALVVDASKRGTHRVEVSAFTGEELVGEAQTVFAVTNRDPELDEVAPDATFLRWLAARTGGRYHEAGTLGPVLIDAEAGRRVDERRETPLWRAPLLALVVALFAGLAWFVRRRAGLA